MIQKPRVSTLGIKGPKDDLGWQSGYGAFSVSQSVRDSVLSYVAKQEIHHRTISFQDEFRVLLNKHGVRFEERYVWD